MTKLTEDMKRVLSQQLPYVATVTDATTPNIGPKRSLRAYDDTTLVYNENTAGQTLKNIEAGSKVAVTVIDWQALEGYRFLGKAEVFAPGTKVYDECAAFAAGKGWAAPKFGVLIHVEDIFTMAPGAKAGKKV